MTLGKAGGSTSKKRVTESLQAALLLSFAHHILIEGEALCDSFTLEESLFTSMATITVYSGQPCINK